MRSASEPLKRTMATPPSPAGVAIAAIVSSLYMKKRVHLNNFRLEGNKNPPPAPRENADAV
jgi:hypothetical protein